jgi:hypothetical protein
MDQGVVEICNFEKMKAVTLDERYYRHAGSIGLARRLSRQARMRVHHLFMDEMHPLKNERILDIGTSDEIGNESNMLEQLYPWRKQLTCASLTDGNAILNAYPGVRHTKIKEGQPLPFDDQEFDIVYSNAVLEHVGTQENQKRFIQEMWRVGRRRFICVPNRLFPVEHHTCIPLINYLPKNIFRSLLKGTKYDLWSREENLNYISGREIASLCPEGASVVIFYTGIGFSIFNSNIAVTG